MKPTPYELLKAFLYAENTVAVSSDLPDDAYRLVRAFVQRTEKIADAGRVWQHGKAIYEALESKMPMPSGGMLRSK